MRKQSLSVVVLLFTAFYTHGQGIVCDILNGIGNSFPNHYYEWNNKLYFLADDSIHGSELWSFDGVNVPKMEFDLNGGTPSGVSGAGAGLIINYKGNLYFPGNVSTYRTELLYRYDGINKPVNIPLPALPAFPKPPGFVAQNVRNFVVADNKLYFIATTSPGACWTDDIYEYDGVNTPQMIKITADTSKLRGGPEGLNVWNGKLYFFAYASGGYNLLYEFDPSTRQKKVLPGSPIGPTPNGYGENNMIGLGNSLYFVGYSSVYGYELYKYDGVSCKRLTDVAPGAWGGVGTGLVSFKGNIYFAGFPDSVNAKLYRYDTLTTKAQKVSNVVFAGSNSGVPTHPNGIVSDLFVFGSEIYFTANTISFGLEIWKSDGVNCAMVADIFPGSDWGMYWGGANFTAFKNKLYFTATNGVSGFEMYSINKASGLSNIRSDVSMTLHPNPCRDVLNLNIRAQKAQYFTAEIVDVQGKIIFRSDARWCSLGVTTMVIPMNQAMSGQYFYRVIDQQNIVIGAGTFLKQ